VHVGRDRVPGRPDQRDRISAFDSLARLDEHLRSVRVLGENAVSVLDLDLITVSVLPTGANYAPGRGSQDRIASIG
jgi:hypothetical protein